MFSCKTAIIDCSSRKGPLKVPRFLGWMWVGVGCQSRSVGLEAGAGLVVGSLAGGLLVSRGRFWSVVLSTHALVEATLVLG